MIAILHGPFDLLATAAGAEIIIARQFFEKLITASDNSWQSLVLISLLAILLASTLYLMNRGWFWIPATAGLLAAQLSIISHWEQAKYGTFATVILAIVVAWSAAAMRFRRIGHDEVTTLFSQATIEYRVTAESINALPQIVQRWMRRADVVGKTTPNKLIVHQRGTLRTAPESRWLPFEATEYFTANPPGFVWIATIHAASFMKIGGRDTYRNGHGNMVIKPLYLFNAADAKGKEIDQGTLVRFLAEMAWFPQAAVSPYLQWQSMSESQARVTMEYGGISGSGIYSFNADGDVIGFEARRYGDFGGIYRKERWSVKTTSFADLGGTRIGNKNQVTWRLPEGDFHWLNMEVIAIAAAR